MFPLLAPDVASGRSSSPCGEHGFVPGTGHFRCASVRSLVNLAVLGVTTFSFIPQGSGAYEGCNSGFISSVLVHYVGYARGGSSFLLLFLAGAFTQLHYASYCFLLLSAVELPAVDLPAASEQLINYMAIG